MNCPGWLYWALLPASIAVSVLLTVAYCLGVLRD
jgi:hypothetical protein